MECVAEYSDMLGEMTGEQGSQVQSEALRLLSTAWVSARHQVFSVSLRLGRAAGQSQAKKMEDCWIEHLRVAGLHQGHPISLSAASILLQLLSKK